MRQIQFSVRGQTPKEIPYLADALDLLTQRFGPYHPQTLAAANSLATAFWDAGDIDQASAILEQAVENSFAEDPIRSELLCTLGELMVEQARFERAGSIYRELTRLCTRRSGANHPSTLAAKGDLALVLFELGQSEEALRLEEEAYAAARARLGTMHPVSNVLAWNRALRLETCGELDLARAIVVDELSWLLTKDDFNLEPDQRIIRSILAERLNWDLATVGHHGKKSERLLI